jgi:hypothetical protein
MLNIYQKKSIYSTTKTLILFLLHFSIPYNIVAQPLIPYNDNGKWGFSDTAGNEIIKPVYSDVDIDYHNNEPIIHVFQGRQYAFLNSKAKKLTNFHNMIEAIGNGYYIVWNSNNKIGIEKNNKLVIPALYEEYIPTKYLEQYKNLKNSIVGIIKRKFYLINYVTHKITPITQPKQIAMKPPKFVEPITYNVYRDVKNDKLDSAMANFQLQQNFERYDFFYANFSNSDTTYYFTITYTNNEIAIVKWSSLSSAKINFVTQFRYQKTPELFFTDDKQKFCKVQMDDYYRILDLNKEIHIGNFTYSYILRAKKIPIANGLFFHIFLVTKGGVDFYLGENGKEYFRYKY